MHFRRAFADAADARLAVPSLEREFLADTVAAVDLHRAVDYAAEHLTRIKLGNRGFHPGVLLAVGLPRTFPGKPARGPQFDLGVRQHPLDRLSACEQFAKGLALPGMLDRHPQRRHADADIACRIGKAQARQQVETQAQPAALRSQPLLDRYPASRELSDGG